MSPSSDKKMRRKISRLPNAIEGASSMAPTPRKKEILPSHKQAEAEHFTAVKAWRVEIYTPD